MKKSPLRYLRICRLINCGLLETPFILDKYFQFRIELEGNKNTQRDKSKIIYFDRFLTIFFFFFNFSFPAETDLCLPFYDHNNKKRNYDTNRIIPG